MPHRADSPSDQGGRAQSLADLQRWADSPAANAAAEAIVALIEAAPKRSRTIQWMPDEDGPGCRFEVIDVNTGGYVAIARVGESGLLALDEKEQGS